MSAHMIVPDSLSDLTSGLCACNCCNCNEANSKAMAIRMHLPAWKTFPDPARSHQQRSLEGAAMHPPALQAGRRTCPAPIRNRSVLNKHSVLTATRQTMAGCKKDSKAALHLLAVKMLRLAFIPQSLGSILSRPLSIHWAGIALYTGRPPIMRKPVQDIPKKFPLITEHSQDFLLTTGFPKGCKASGSL